ncbi:carotenoid ester lipase [Trametes meyenii]|nr:carotenoid ester lipase [Trametes meyenii]
MRIRLALFGSFAILKGLAAELATVKLDEATVIGTSDGILTQFLGIPFAQPPVGNLRLQLPQPVGRHHGIINATTFGNQCIQQSLPVVTLPKSFPPEIAPFVNGMPAPADIPQSEDCLNLNIIVPAGTRRGDKLPIAVWLFGGGFQIGSNAVRPGAVVVNRSLELGQPIIFIAVNYRLSAFGFLGGREIANAGLGNLGLQDQRESFRWIQRNIEAFGGDPEKVTIWGESAGSSSIALHMLTNDGNTEGLFRAGWMESGAASPLGNLSLLQPTFDLIASHTGCSSEIDIIQCLREIPTDALKAAMDLTPTYLSFQALNTPWMPRADGFFLKEDGQRLLLGGKVANIPFVLGSNEDEGTLDAINSLNITTEVEATAYIKNNYFSTASHENITRLLELFPADPALGSPFGTGKAFAFTPQYKRLAAFQGDLYFTAARRLFLQQLADKQVVRSYLYARNKIPGLGAAHTTELTNVFGGGDMTDFLIRFVNTLDPNDGRGVHWPVYNIKSPRLLEFTEGKTPLKVIPDTFRKEANEFLAQLGLENPF